MPDDEVDPSSSVQLRPDGFEGPLDLLLELARRQRVDLARISIVTLVDQYLEAVTGAGRTDLIQAADWLVMAAWLTWLKSRLLLPADPGDVQEAEQAQHVLTQRLAELDRVRAVAVWLDGQPQLGWDTFERGHHERPEAAVPVANATMLAEACLGVFRLATARPVALYQPRRIVGWTPHHAMNRRQSILHEHPQGGDLLDFVPTLPAGLSNHEQSLRVAIASTFVAGLEPTRGDDMAVFLPKRGKPRAKRLAPAVEATITQAIDDHYARASRPSLLSLHDVVVKRCVAAGVTAPSYRAVQSRARDRDHAWLIRRRHGPKAARALRLLTGAHPDAAAPWERVQIDSTPCDILLVREEDRAVVGHPNFTVAVDLYSRVVPGFFVALEAASTVTVATCLAHACLPKEDWLARRGLGSVHWPVYGKPRILEYDQGPENEARGIQRGLRRHGIASKTRAEGHPEQRGTIERLIGTVMRIVHGLRGTTFSNVNERGEAEPEKRACLTLPELERVLALAADTYNHATHDGIGERPMDRTLAWHRRPELREADRIPPRLPPDRLLLDFLPSRCRRTTHGH